MLSKVAIGKFKTVFYAIRKLMKTFMCYVLFMLITDLFKFFFSPDGKSFQLD